MILDDLLARDSLKPHDAPPHGVPTSYDWQARPVLQHATPPVGYSYTNPWGQVYWRANETAFEDYGCRVEIRELQAWLLSRDTLTWSPAYPSPPTLTGTWWNEDFSGSGAVAAIDTSRPGSILTRVPQGKLMHFYPSVRRVLIDQRDICGVAVTCRARLTLIPNSAQTPEWILNVGADWWPDPISGPVRGVGQGRFKSLDVNQWRVYGFTTAPAIPLAQTLDAEWY